LRGAKELEKYEARRPSNALHGLYDRLKKALENKPPPEQRIKLARNVKRTMKRLMEKRYSKAKDLKGFPVLVHVRRNPM